jgi:hypothetical protein
VVDRLERDGFVERLRDDNDRRVVLAALTPHGRQMFDAFSTRMRLEFTRFLGALSADDRTTFVDVFGRAAAVLCGRAPLAADPDAADGDRSSDEGARLTARASAPKAPDKP